MKMIAFNVSDEDSLFLDRLAEEVGMSRQDVVQFCFGRLAEGLRRPGISLANANNVLGELYLAAHEMNCDAARAARDELELRAMDAACSCIAERLSKAAGEMSDRELQDIIDDRECRVCECCDPALEDGKSENDETVL